ncbi:hypothetical protein TrLO_g1934 [Triparma laevis f. longispina]|uniref:Uncharacterized protein n=1 Tax=Triparma laevis f. longispina TaxID=1714387 RepID=A0A9W7AUK0_9STRA|nr:hypothetical protein TrLO_g1934 [Triparma laevis f. longispina]
MSALRLGGSANSSPNEIPLDVHKLLNLVLSNASKDEPKYHKVNLSGKAGTKLQSSDLAMAGWTIVGTELVIESRGNALRNVSSRVLAEYERSSNVSAVPAAPVAPAVVSTAGLSLKQQARLKKEEEEKQQRMEATKAKKRKSGGLSMKQQARQMQEEEEKKEMMEKQKEKEILKAKIESDKFVRANDPNWSASVAGDKSQGQNQTTFRDKFGEDKGG